VTILQEIKIWAMGLNTTALPVMKSGSVQ